MLERGETESTDDDERSVLLAAVTLEAAVAASLGPLPFCSSELEVTGDAPVRCIASAITGELEPLSQTIPDPLAGPLDPVPDAEVPEPEAG
jgi:hypothetical protein